MALSFLHHDKDEEPFTVDDIWGSVLGLIFICSGIWIIALPFWLLKKGGEKLKESIENDLATPKGRAILRWEIILALILTPIVLLAPKNDSQHDAGLPTPSRSDPTKQGTQPAPIVGANSKAIEEKRIEVNKAVPEPIFCAVRAALPEESRKPEKDRPAAKPQPELPLSPEPAQRDGQQSVMPLPLVMSAPSEPARNDGQPAAAFDMTTGRAPISEQAKQPSPQNTDESRTAEAPKPQGTVTGEWEDDARNTFNVLDSGKAITITLQKSRFFVQLAGTLTRRDADPIESALFLDGTFKAMYRADPARKEYALRITARILDSDHLHVRCLNKCPGVDRYGKFVLGLNAPPQFWKRLSGP